MFFSFKQGTTIDKTDLGNNLITEAFFERLQLLNENMQELPYPLLRLIMPELTVRKD